uniref:Diphthine--ammonia ligase n=1 Tax=Nothobranchius furzeri TaxID=105023 RepID=A0A8C6Q1F7_NOTFU
MCPILLCFSGGKDSCYNMMQCVAAGHQIVALANLRPAQTDELDSYMYQTVGHQGIELYADAMDLPLYRHIIQGSSMDTSRDYSKTEGDEVEDLHQLLHLVKLSTKYGVHICGEGGEYETFTLDCPLFKKKIVIDAAETVIHSADAFAPVGYLRFTKMHTEDKHGVSLTSIRCVAINSVY